MQQQTVIQDLEAAVADTEAKIAEKKEQLAGLRAELKRYRRALGAVTGRPTSRETEDSRRGEAHVEPGRGRLR
jgi:outer membrane protein TolC